MWIRHTKACACTGVIAVPEVMQRDNEYEGPETGPRTLAEAEVTFRYTCGKCGREWDQQVVVDTPETVPADTYMNMPKSVYVVCVREPDALPVLKLARPYRGIRFIREDVLLNVRARLEDFSDTHIFNRVDKAAVDAIAEGLDSL